MFILNLKLLTKQSFIFKTENMFEYNLTFQRTIPKLKKNSLTDKNIPIPFVWQPFNPLKSKYCRLLGSFAPIFYLNCEHVLFVYILKQRRKKN